MNRGAAPDSVGYGRLRRTGHKPREAGRAREALSPGETANALHTQAIEVYEMTKRIEELPIPLTSVNKPPINAPDRAGWHHIEAG
jgi:hypothetical protein